MKILKYGEGYPKTVTCDGCKSELEYNNKDVFYWSDVLDEIIDMGAITCPVCGRSIVVYEHSRPNPDCLKKKRWWQR